MTPRYKRKKWSPDVAVAKKGKKILRKWKKDSAENKSPTGISKRKISQLHEIGRSSNG